MPSLRPPSIGSLCDLRFWGSLNFVNKTSCLVLKYYCHRIERGFEVERDTASKIHACHIAPSHMEFLLDHVMMVPSLDFFFSFMCICVLMWEFMCTTYVQVPMEAGISWNIGGLQFQVVVSLHVGAGT